ncbi:MAG: hypothetical protein U5J95_09760 [Balneolaceae bacterium]|nr:hypothetical protein [Balneolaceae bacterium]
MSVIFLFIDGVGLGADDPSNPFSGKKYESFLAMSNDQPFTKFSETVQKKNHLFKPVDATLGVNGLPQSGTGQTALFTGKNAPQKIGKHFGPFPHSGIKDYLRKESLFNRLKEREKTGHFINAYPQIFFEKAEQRNRWSCTTLMTKSAGFPLNRTEDVKEGRAITAGINQQAWREQLSIDVPVIEEKEAADRLLNAAMDFDVVLYEYYLTDKAGHSQNLDKAESVIQTYDRFLLQLIKEKRAGDTLVLCSDHGNVEDLSTKTHTFNKVPLFVLGPGAQELQDAENIMDITPGILRMI